MILAERESYENSHAVFVFVPYRGGLSKRSGAVLPSLPLTSINRPILAVWKMIGQQLATDDSKQTGKKSLFDCLPPFIIRRPSAAGRVVHHSRGQKHATSHLRADSRNIFSSPIHRGHHWRSVPGHPLLW